MKLSKFIIISFLFLIFLPSVLGACTRVDPVVYVNDSGDSTNCPGYDYTTINEALNAHPSCVYINVCDGTYNENISIDNTKGIFIKGITTYGDVIINNSSLLNIIDSNDIYLKDLKFKNGSYGLNIYSSKDIDLENISISDMSGSLYNSGLSISNSSDVSVKGNISVSNISGINNSVGIRFYNVENLDLSEITNLDISSITSSQEYSLSIGINFENIKNSIIINSELLISNINSNSMSIGLGIIDSNVSLNDSVLISNINSEGGLYGVKIDNINNLKNNIVFNNITNIENLEANILDAYGIFISGNNDVLFNNSVIIDDISSSEKVYGVFGDNCNIKIKDTFEIFSLNSLNEKNIYSIYLDSSVGEFFDIFDGVEYFPDHTIVSIKGTSFFVNNYFNLSFGADRCYDISDGAFVSLSNQILDNCDYSFFINNGLVMITDSEINPLENTIFLDSSSSYSVVAEYDNIKFNLIDSNNNFISNHKFIFIDPETDEIILVTSIDKDGKVSFPRFIKELKDGIIVLKDYSIIDLGIFSDGYSSVYYSDLPFPELSQIFIQTLQNTPSYIDSFVVTTQEEDLINFLSYPISFLTCDSSLDNALFCMDIKKPFYDQEYNFKNAKIKFKLLISDLDNLQIPIDGIEVLHKNEDVWEEILVKYEGENQNYRFYSIEVDSFSEFALIANPAGCMVDSDCNNNYICNNNFVCECNLSCLSGYILDKVNCICEKDILISNPGSNDGNNDVNILNPFSDFNYLDDSNILANDSNILANDSNILANDLANDSNDLNNSIRGQNNVCDIKCPEDTLLDQERCVCIAKSPTNNLGLYILLGLIAIILVVGGIYVLNNKPKSSNKPVIKNKIKANPENIKKKNVSKKKK
ncbi:MAG: PGF-pre-PGF domain-containing protein [Candidatus ainarchaeum sp.]|nr:PGF-pre-PGF domain-containing protein [Candidatus ainarchaeum sp.]MDD3975540.1 PGF-pre-PGF domain-containing protein [Candidatus ainarchaeum sp.]